MNTSHHHSESDDYSNREAGPEPEGIRFQWNTKSLAVMGTMLTVLATFTTFQVTHWIDASVSNQKQDDRLAILEAKQTKLEGIAEVNTQARIKLETQMDQIIAQHAQMLQNQEELKRMLIDSHSQLRHQSQLLERERFRLLQSLVFRLPSDRRAYSWAQPGQPPAVAVLGH